MRRRGHAVAAAAAAAILGATDAIAQNLGPCQQTGFTTNASNRFASQTMTVGANGRCRSNMTGARLQGTRVDTPASNGRVELEGLNYAYIPNRDFVGTDMFAVSWYNPVIGDRVGVTVNVRVERAGAMSASGSQASPPARNVCTYHGAGSVSAGQRYGAATMVVSRDGRCTGIGYGALRATRLETPASHGRVEVGDNRHTYIPTPGYVGSDSYIFSYENGGTRVSITVSVSVVQ